MEEIMCPSCEMGLCAYCKKEGCSCHENPTGVSKLIHKTLRKLDNENKM